MKSITLDIPNDVNESEVIDYLSAILFEKGILSSGQAAKMSGKSRKRFIEEVGQYGISIFGETLEDLNSTVNL
jgi:predicted HTH domain antitoxin